MRRGLLSGLDKADNHPYLGWGVTSGSEPMPAPLEVDTESSLPEDDDVCLLEEDHSGEYATPDASPPQRCLSAEHKNPKDYQCRDGYKIPKKRQHSSDNQSSSNESQFCLSSPKIELSSLKYSVKQGLKSSRAAEIGYRILRQAQAGRSKPSCLRPSLSTKTVQKHSVIKRWTHADPPPTSPEHLGQDHSSSSDLDIINHESCPRTRGETNTAHSPKSENRTDVGEESSSTNSTQEQDSVISTQAGNEQDNGKSVGECKMTKNRKTQLALSQSSSVDEDYDDAFAEHCVNCRGLLAIDGICRKCSSFNELPSKAATPRGPLRKSPGSFYSGQSQKPPRTYGKSQGQSVKPNLSKIVADFDSDNKKLSPTTRGKGRKNTKSSQTSKRGKRNSGKIAGQAKKQKKEEPVVITLSDEDDQPEEITSFEEHNKSSSFGEDPSSLCGDEMVIPESPPDKTPEKPKSRSAQMRLQGGELPRPKKRKSSSDENTDHCFERDNFGTVIMIGTQVLIGKLVTSAAGPLKIRNNQIMFEVEYEKKTLPVSITGNDLVMFEVCLDPGRIFLSVTQKLALQLKKKIPEVKNFLDSGSIVCAERKIFLTVSKPLTREWLADLCEWVQDKLSKEFRELDSSEARQQYDNALAYATQAKEVANASSRYNTRSRSITKSSQPVQQLLVFPPPPTPGGITITTADIECLGPSEFLNDVIIDFYLKYVVHEKLKPEDRSRTHVFSSFFYNRLTQKNGNADTSLGKSEQMHSKVKTWTRHVNIFEKDFLVIPINESSHWYLAVICFPSLEQPIYEEKDEDISQNGTGITNGGEPSQDTDEDFDENTTLSGKKSSQPRFRVSSRPCILIFDSLGNGGNRSKVTFNLRNYLTCEWQEKMKDREPREFSKDTMKGSSPKVPLQDNYCDCGLFLLQYVESFFENPILDYKIPGLNLLDWFPQARVAQKRQEIQDLIYKLKSERDESSC